MAFTFVRILTLGAALAGRFAASSPLPAVITLPDPFGQNTITESASIAGVDAQGHTTYIITQGGLTETLVQGSDFASFTLVEPQATTTAVVGGACSLGLPGGEAACQFAQGSESFGTTYIPSGFWFLDVGDATVAAPAPGATPSSGGASGAQLQASGSAFSVPGSSIPGPATTSKTSSATSMHSRIVSMAGVKMSGIAAFLGFVVACQLV
ncbi:hypothetical protein FB45DRAFT_919769 [Roridomyces roridus]|uniref:GPI anchored cell wall protein n=1 Tax=Roridomyces roridus TaxID=1738132 RepID=A0AAD7BS56_9AGAR|nr:hypothetical protein FB45DRAFT_919769 [Roridomyces roridus]